VRTLLLLLVLLSVLGCAGWDSSTKTASQSSVSQEDVRERAYNYRIKMAISYIKSGNFKKALLEAFRAQEAKETPEVYNIIGLAYMGLGELEKAKDSFLKAVELDPNYSEAWTNLSAYYLAKGEWKKAIEACKKALSNKYYTKPEVAFTNMARAYLMLGDEKKAVEYWVKSLRYNTYYVPAYESLIDYYMAKDDIAKARAYLEDAKALELNSPGIMFYDAIFKMRDGNTVEAERILSKIVRDYPLTVWAKRARVYLDAMR